MLACSIIAVSLVVLFVGYLIGYRKGATETAFAENQIGKDAFELNVLWGASIAHDNPQARPNDIVGLVLKRKDELERLTADELVLVALGRAELTDCVQSEENHV